MYDSASFLSENEFLRQMFVCRNNVLSAWRFGSRILTREMLAERIWGDGEYVDENGLTFCHT